MSLLSRAALRAVRPASISRVGLRAVSTPASDKQHNPNPNSDPNGPTPNPNATPTGTVDGPSPNPNSAANYSYQYDGPKNEFHRTKKGNLNNILLAGVIAAIAGGWYYWETLQMRVFGPNEDVTVITFEPTEATGALSSDEALRATNRKV